MNATRTAGLRRAIRWRGRPRRVPVCPETPPLVRLEHPFAYWWFTRVELPDDEGKVA